MFHFSIFFLASVVGTIVVRILMFPLVIISQRNAAKMHNILPGLQVIQVKMSDARERGDRIEGIYRYLF